MAADEREQWSGGTACCSGSPLPDEGTEPRLPPDLDGSGAASTGRSAMEDACVLEAKGSRSRPPALSVEHGTAGGDGVVGEEAHETPAVEPADVEDSGRTVGAEGAWLATPTASAEAVEDQERVCFSIPPG